MNICTRIAVVAAALALCLTLLLVSDLTGKAHATTLFINDEAGFDAAVAALTFAGTEDWESSTLAPAMITSFADPLAPGVANGPFPTGTNPATGLTAQSNTLGGMPSVLSPGAGLATASAPYSGTPNDQVSTSGPGASFDMIFGLANTHAVSFTPLVFDVAESGAAGTANLRVFDTSNTLIGSLDDIAVAGFTNPTTFIGVVAMPGEDIGRINLFATSFEDVFTGADNIDVYTVSTSTPIPEPSTWLLLLTGVVGLGFSAWRRRQG